MPYWIQALAWVVVLALLGQIVGVGAKVAHRLITRRRG